MDDLDSIGLDDDGNLYWRGRRVVTQQIQRLAGVERFFGILAVGAAVIGVAVQVWSWGCDLRWSAIGWCPPMEHQVSREAPLPETQQ
ncbi:MULTISPECIES: hypothetical protein [unclassified Ruegeria]|uniref:hypothetical protein n=1 Tax=unclassified Ruegeria TaxID=2625375 RepID=UPI0014914741|nr:MULTISPECIES: hypothetical protein [unclassified Ruegeria]NOD88374.1 hypothetical protein [Ruegeria sp. HKCCD4318]NOE13283.1 hypothetical protein [Ruegeria sp. HKCCD4318-2]NOG11175.1 hypothetical protein [Ruegeria sp. HKCCD4315]